MSTAMAETADEAVHDLVAKALDIKYENDRLRAESEAIRTMLLHFYKFVSPRADPTPLGNADLADDIFYILELNEKLGDENWWQDISTAPQDGTQVDLWCRAPGLSAGPDRVPDCWYSGGHWWRHDEQYGDDQCRSRVHNATHWRARPEPPVLTPSENCPHCGGEGSNDIHRPQHDDPNYCEVVKCSHCNGSGLKKSTRAAVMTQDEHR